MSGGHVHVPILLIDVVGFTSDYERVEHKRVLLRDLQELLGATARFYMPHGDPWKKWHRHGTGDGYYLLFDGLGPAVAAEYARRLGEALAELNAAHSDVPIRLRQVLAVIEERCEDGGFLFFVMEHLSGGDLRRAVLDGHFDREGVLRIVREVGEALAFAHARNVVHRDVKPGNVLLDAEGHAKLTDFDLVRAVDTTGGTRTGMMGTVVYAAPELLYKAQKADARADVYGLGMTAIFALTGEDLPLDVLRDAASFVVGLEVDDFSAPSSLILDLGV